MSGITDRYVAYMEKIYWGGRMGGKPIKLKENKGILKIDCRVRIPSSRFELTYAKLFAANYLFSCSKTRKKQLLINFWGIIGEFSGNKNSPLTPLFSHKNTDRLQYLSVNFYTLPRYFICLFLLEVHIEVCIDFSRSIRSDRMSGPIVHKFR